MKLLIISNIISLLVVLGLGAFIFKFIKFPKFNKDIFAKVWYIVSNIILFLICAFLYYFRLIWFVVILVLVAIYCKIHWLEIISLDKINANAIIFLLLITLLLYPLLSNFKIGDISGNCYDLFNFDKAKEKMDMALEKLTSKDFSRSKLDQEELTKKIQDVENARKGGDNV